MSVCKSLSRKDLTEHYINEYVECVIGNGFREFQRFREEVKAARNVCYRARWPNWHTESGRTPGENFKVNDACKLLNLAHNIFGIVKTILYNFDYPPLQ